MYDIDNLLLKSFKDILYDMESELLPIEEIDVTNENKPNEEYDYDTLED
tara:strand:+ start:145 stop:291 length:147 start_codon:yes stop_codon:yes gene_type:complete